MANIKLRGRAEVARKAHNLEVGSSSLPPATGHFCTFTNEKVNKKIMRGDNIPDGFKLGRKLN